MTRVLALIHIFIAFLSLLNGQIVRRLQPILLLRTSCAIRLALTLRLLMSYIYMEHLFLMFLDHTQRRTTVGRTPLDE